jgi:hypothetical protein
VKRPTSKPPVRPKRSVPTVDKLPDHLRTELGALATASNKAQLQALDRVEKGQAETRTVLKSMRSLQIATFLLVGLLAVFVTVEAVKLDSLDRRVEHLEHP